MKSKSYLELNIVQEFIKFLTDVVCGKSIDAGYHDLTLKEKVIFKTLEDAFNGYYWPKRPDDFSTNNAALAPLQRRLLNAIGSNNNSDIRDAIDEILLWGAGGNKTKIYSSNTTWLDTKNTSNRAIELIKNANMAFGDTFTPASIGDHNVRSNAGFTKVYALAFDDFIIYDSRVAAALGYLAVLFFSGLTEKLSKVPGELDFSWASAAWKDNRNPSIDPFKFSRTGSNQERHAYSNWRANLILREVCNKVAKDNPKNWALDAPGSPMRRLEAALFMLGKNVPGNTAKLKTEEIVAILKRPESRHVDGEWILLQTIARSADFIVREDEEGNVEFRFGNESRSKITLTAASFETMCGHFSGLKSVALGAVREKDRRPEGSLGNWLASVPETHGVSIASYVAPYLIYLGLASRSSGDGGKSLDFV